MAHFKRGKCRYKVHRPIRGSDTSWRARWGLKPVRFPEIEYWPEVRSAEWNAMFHPRGRHGNRGRKISGPYSQMSSYPAWHDILFHTRPLRRATKRCEHKVIQGADADDLAWPLAKKPHKYYW